MALLDNEDKDDIDEALDIYEKYKLKKVRIKKAESETQQDLAARWQRLEQELEIDRLKALQGLSVEVLLMAAKDPQQQKLFHSLSLEKIRGQFTPDRIAALRIGENPELDNKLKEIILGLHNTGKLEQYERLIKEVKENAGMQREIYQSQMQALMQMFNQALETTGKMAGGGPH